MKVIDEFDVSDSTRLRLQIGEYKDRERVDLRQYILKGDSYIATKRGIFFDSEWIPKFLEMVEKLKLE